jgi:protein-S-isoprenylcysteine O-methyltransferase Ste14
MSSPPPRSVSSQWVALAGCGGFLLTLATASHLKLDRAWLILLTMAGTALPMIVLELGVRRAHRFPSTGLDFDGAPSPWDLRRIATKLLGLYATFGALALVYWAVPEYERSFYQPFWDLLDRVLWPLIAAAVPYVAWLDRRMVEPRDGLYQAGRLALGRWHGLDGKALQTHALGWVIKGFYLPLMTVYLGDAARWLSTHGPLASMDDFPGLVTYAAKLSLGLDLAFVAIGYALMLRLLDTHLRSANPYMYGWVFTLMLYQPFWSLMSKRFFAYGDGDMWLDHMRGVPLLLGAWGVLIILSKLGWAWANMSFGLRFSNLTHRGIITNGPYRFTKHPSYLFKNLSWWLLSVPFLSGDGPAEATRHVLALLGVNLLYAVRARAEEQHLSEDPDYVRYALWMNEHGLLAGLGRWLPWLRYRPPEGAQSNSGRDQ